MRGVAAGLLALAACSPYAHLTAAGPRRASSAECGHCHVAVYDEWRASTHARSWIAPDFVAATAGRSVESCLGCHAPDSVFGPYDGDGAPLARDELREEGVSCLACHFDGDVLAGPAPSTALVHPHPVAEERALYRSAELCGRCHEGTWAEWRGARDVDERTCQECHMPAVTRTLTQATGTLSKVLVSFEDEFEGRRHSFHLGALTGFEDALDARLGAVRREVGRTRVEVVLENRLPHAVPTGDFGPRVVRVRATGLDGEGRELGAWERELRRALGTSLAPGEVRSLSIELEGEVRELRLAVERPRAGAPPLALLERDWTLP